MLRNYNFVIFGIFLATACFGMLFSIAYKLPSAYAQTCGGSSSCFSSTWKDTTWTEQYTTEFGPLTVTCHTCDYTGGDHSSSCQHYGAQNENPYCKACVENDESCTNGIHYYGNPDQDCYEYVTIQAYPLEGNNCPGGDEEKPCWGSCITYCDSNPLVQCGACNASEPANTCGSTSGDRTCKYGGPGSCTPHGSPQQACSYNYDNCSNNYTCPAGAGFQQDCETHIFVHVYIDYGHDGSHDANYPFGVVKLNGGNAQTTGADGSVTYGGLTTGNYTISYADNSPDYAAVGATTQNVNLTNNNGDVTVNFRVTPLYKISGNVFNDKNKNLNYDGPDSLYQGNTTIHVAGGPTNVNDMSQSDSTFDTGEVLWSGNYTVSQTHSLDAGYQYTTPSSWSVTVGNTGTAGPNCNVSTSPDAACGNPSNGSISNLNFGMTNEHPHEQAVCMDVRTDNQGNGTISNPFPPAGATCGGENGSQAIINNGVCSTGSGIVYSCNGTYDFDLGTNDANNWSAGGASQDTECYSGPGLDVIPTSYGYMTTTAKESNITPVNLDNLANPNPNTSCTTTDCVLPPTLPKGLYKVNGDLTLDAALYTFPAPADPTTTSQAYIILVNGDLHIKGNILVPKGTVVVFSASGSIYVDKNVGNNMTSSASVTNNAPNLEGIYSADKSFIVETAGTGNNICNADGSPLDKRLVVLGIIITNAAKGGGQFTDNRDLCIYDTSCSTTVSGDGGNGGDGMGGDGQGLLLNYLLDVMADGKFMLNKNFNWQELRP